MLRITVIENQGHVTFQLEGKLVGAWVQELERCWKETLAGRRGVAIRFDLTGITFVDAAGKRLLATMHAQGADFVASGCLMRAIVAEISQASPTVNGQRTNNFWEKKS
jgi:anti-anti-sigma regulatory factor